MLNHVLASLNERAKELNCLYELDEILKYDQVSLENLFRAIVSIIPKGWQHPTLCEARLTYLGRVAQTSDFEKTPWCISSEILVDGNPEGLLEVVYLQVVNEPGRVVFLPQEQRLLNSIADRIGHFLFSRKLRHSLELMREALPPADEAGQAEKLLVPHTESHWKWRQKMAGILAGHLNPAEFGVQGLYLIGSTYQGTAGEGSDLDLLVHFTGDDNQKRCLKSWMEGWSLCLAEINFERTGYRSPQGLIDLHLVSNQDIEQRTSFGLMVESGSKKLI